jgi:hypothetical protein
MSVVTRSSISLPFESHRCPPGTDAGDPVEVHVHVGHVGDLVAGEAKDARLYGCVLRPHSVYVNFLGHHRALFLPNVPCPLA